MWNTEVGLALTARRSVARSRCGRAFTRMQALLERYDVLAAPVSQVVPLASSEFPREIAGVEMSSYLEWMRSCSRITVTSHPAISVPAGFTRRLADRSPARREPSRRGGAAAPRSGLHGGDGPVRAKARALMPWPSTPPTVVHRAAFADASPHPFWLALGSGRPAAGAGGGDRGRPVHRRRRLHRAVGGAVREVPRPRRATSSCSRPRRRGSARPGATAGSAWRR